MDCCRNTENTEDFHRVCLDCIDKLLWHHRRVCLSIRKGECKSRRHEDYRKGGKARINLNFQVCVRFPVCSSIVSIVAFSFSSSTRDFFSFHPSLSRLDPLDARLFRRAARIRRTLVDEGVLSRRGSPPTRPLPSSPPARTLHPHLHGCHAL